MERTILAMECNHIKIGDMVQIEGIAIEEGVWTDSYGRKLTYVPAVIANSVASLVGKPIIEVHTDNDEDHKKVVGVVTEAWRGTRKVGNKELTNVSFKGLIYNKSVGERVLTGALSKYSIEAGYLADSAGVITSLDNEAVALTMNPACTSSTTIGAQRVSTIKLEKEKKMTDTDLTPEEITKLKNKLGIEDKKPSKSWDDMTEDEKTGVATVHLQKKGVILPKELPKKVANEAGVEEWSFPKGYPVELQAIITGLDTKMSAKDGEIVKLQKEIEVRDNDEVNRLFNEIKMVDPEFQKDNVVKMEKSPARQKAIMQSYLDNMTRLKPKFTVGAQTTTSKPEAEEIDKIAMEAFAMTPVELEESLGKEARK